MSLRHLEDHTDIAENACGALFFMPFIRGSTSGLPQRERMPVRIAAPQGPDEADRALGGATTPGERIAQALPRSARGGGSIGDGERGLLVRQVIGAHP